MEIKIVETSDHSQKRGDTEKPDEYETLKSILLGIAVAICLLSCSSGNKCDKYIGNWVAPNTKSPGSGQTNGGKFSITKSGDSYILQGDISGYFYDYKAALDYEQDKLVLKGLPVIGDSPLTLLDDGKTILVFGQSFTKQ